MTYSRLANQFLDRRLVGFEDGVNHFAGGGVVTMLIELDAGLNRQFAT